MPSPILLKTPSARQRVRLALIAGVGIFILSSLYRLLIHEAYGDLNWPLCAAAMLRMGRDPYAICVVGDGYPPNMMTTALVALPFSFLPASIAASAIFACSCALLTYGLTRDTLWPLGLFGSAPFWIAFQWMQWSPLILAITLLPSLLPLFLAKPHIGLPMALTRLTWRRAFGCVAFGLISLAIDPLWPLRWWSNAQGYNGFIPLLVIPGPLVLLALARRQEMRGRFLLLAGIMPQRGFYDPLILFCLPDSPRQMLFMALSSWTGYGCALAIGGDIRIWIVLFLYGPALLLVLLSPKRATVQELAAATDQNLSRPQDTPLA